MVIKSEGAHPPDATLCQIGKAVAWASQFPGHIYIHSSGLSHDDLEKMGATKVKNVHETVSALLKTHPSAVVVPEGPYVVGMVR